MKFIFISLFVLSASFCFSQTELTGTFNAKITKKITLNYLLVKPQNATQKMPLIVFLHGSGERGNDLEKVKAHGPLKFIKHDTLNTFILAPQCAENNVWDAEELYLLIQEIIAKNDIDTNRIYLTGLSMGAWGAWNLAYAHPEMFAVLVPIAGFVDRVPMIEGCKIKNIPIRMFHGLLDNVVDVQYSINIFKKLKDCNKDIKLEIFDFDMHDSWTRVYEHKEIYNWMLNQHKQ
ncbi:MAG: dienelactone hydrolase family protein [Bacteroidia bacterium]